VVATWTIPRLEETVAKLFLPRLQRLIFNFLHNPGRRFALPRAISLPALQACNSNDLSLYHLLRLHVCAESVAPGRSLGKEEVQLWDDITIRKPFKGAMWVESPPGKGWPPAGSESCPSEVTKAWKRRQRVGKPR